MIGSGQMGTGIAIVANRKGGYPVEIIDSNEVSLQSSKRFIEKYFDKEILKEKMSQKEKELYMNRFTFSNTLKKLFDTDFVIEVIKKQRLFNINEYVEL